MNAFAEDAVYHNIPMEPCHGVEQIRGFIEGFMGTLEGGIEFEILRQVATDSLVMNERIDRFVIDGKQVAAPVCGVFELTADGENILDGAMENGLDLPYSCKGGVCATCKAKLIEGQVDMDLNHALSPQELADGFVLTCQAHPISNHVVVDFDVI